MEAHNVLAPLLRKPEANGFNDILDSGLRRNNGNTLNGTAVIYFLLLEAYEKN